MMNIQPGDYDGLCILCSRVSDKRFCSSQCDELHEKRLLKLNEMSEEKYEPGYALSVIWSDEDREYIFVYGDNRSALIGNFEQAYQFMKV